MSAMSIKILIIFWSNHGHMLLPSNDDFHANDHFQKANKVFILIYAILYFLWYYIFWLCIGHVKKRKGSKLKALKVKIKKKFWMVLLLVDKVQKTYNYSYTPNTKIWQLGIMMECKISWRHDESIWAENFHSLLSKERPQYGLCPDRNKTWCKYFKS